MVKKHFEALLALLIFHEIFVKLNLKYDRSYASIRDRKLQLLWNTELYWCSRTVIAAC